MKEILDTLISFSPAKDAIKVEVDPDRLRPIDADLQVPNTAKFHAHTGWKPEIPHEKKTLRDCWTTGGPRGNGRRPFSDPLRGQIGETVGKG